MSSRKTLTLTLTMIIMILVSGCSEVLIPQGEYEEVLSYPENLNHEHGQIAEKKTHLPSVSDSQTSEEVKNRPSRHSPGSPQHSVMGYIWDANMRPVPDARVTAFAEDGTKLVNTIASSVTARGIPTGFYVLHSLPQGWINVRVECSAFSQTKPVLIASQKYIWLNFSQVEDEPVYKRGSVSLPYSGHSSMLGSIAIYSVDSEKWSEDTLLPLVAHISLNGEIKGRMYDAILLITGRFYYDRNSYQGPSRADFSWYANLSFDILDTLENVSGRVKETLHDDVLFKVILSAAYFKYEKNASWSVSELTRKWMSKNYRNLTLAGFYWAYSEGEIDASYEGIRGTADFIHNLSLNLVWCPFFLAPMWSYWHEFGIDYVVMQPNFAYNPYDPWRFEVLASLRASGEIHGVNFEIAYTRENNLSIQENANIHIDYGFRFRWWENPANMFYVSPGYLDEYARGGSTIPVRYRPIYDRQYQFLHLNRSIILKAEADAYIFEKPVTLWQKNTPRSEDLLLKRDRNTLTRVYLRFPAMNPYISIYSAILTLNVISVESPCLVTIYTVSRDWNESAITRMNAPPPEHISGISWFNRSGISAFSLGFLSSNLSLVLIPENEPCMCTISAREGVKAPLLNIGFFEPVESMIQADKDAYTSDHSPSENYGNLTFLLAGSTQGSVTRAYLMFSLDACTSLCAKPRLLLYVLNRSENLQLMLGVIDNSTWGEDAVSWDNQPQGNLKILIRNITLEKNISEIPLSFPDNDTFTLTLFSPVYPRENWVKVASRESISPPMILILIKAFES